MAIRTYNFWEDRIDPSTRRQFKPEMLVLHITDGSYRSTVATIEQDRSQVSYNYLFHNGELEQVVHPRHAAWANGKKVRPSFTELHKGVNPNLYTISVSVVSRGELPKIGEWIKWAKACKEICEEWNIPMNKTHIVNHNEIRGDKMCPGKWHNRFWFLFLKNV